jgi:hypothetical protein
LPDGDWVAFHQLVDCWDPMVIGWPFTSWWIVEIQWWLGVLTSWWIVEKRSSFSYFWQNQKNYQQWLFSLSCAISQKFVLRLNTAHDDDSSASVHRALLSLSKIWHLRLALCWRVTNAWITYLQHKECTQQGALLMTATVTSVRVKVLHIQTAWLFVYCVIEVYNGQHRYSRCLNIVSYIRGW